MFVIVHYNGQYRRGYITDFMTRWGETFAEVIMDDYKVPKCVHFNQCRYDWSAQTTNAT